MKNQLTRTLLALVAFALTVTVTPARHAQAEKVKDRAKDLKKKVEGGETAKTNTPPARPAPTK